MNASGETTGGATGFMAECFWPGATEKEVQEAGTRAQRAAAASDGDDVRYLGAIFVPADEIAFCLFKARSAEAVRQISERAGVPFERIVEAVTLEAIPPAGPSTHGQAVLQSRKDDHRPLASLASERPAQERRRSNPAPPTTKGGSRCIST